MLDSFYKHWFHGFEEALADMPEAQRSRLLAHCGRVYEIRYRECLCDLYRDGLMRSPALCECSRQSLLYNLSQVFPEKRVAVSLRGSILAGDDKCVLCAALD